MNISSWFKRRGLLIDIGAYALCCVFIAAGILVSLNRFWQYEIFFYDFGIFDQAIWEVSRFQPPIIDHLVVGGKWIFADHFNPSIFLLSPLFWLTSRSEVLLIVQSISVGISGVTLYMIGVKVLKKRFLSFSILITYLLFIGLQNAVISDFHEVTISTLTLMLIFWAIFNKKPVLYFIFLLLTLGFKESTFVLGIGIGVFVILSVKGWLKIGLATIFLSLAWGFIAIKLIIPFFSGGIYQYGEVLSSIPIMLTALIDSPEKRNTIFYSFLSFGFVPFFSPSSWILILQDLFLRFIPQWPTRWGLGLHYSAQLSSILAVSSLLGIRFLQRYKFLLRYLNLFGVIIIINSIFLYRFILHGPLALSYNPVFYKHTADFKFLEDFLKTVPDEGSIMAQNNLATRFTHRKTFLLRDAYYLYNPDFIVLDLREGQNPNDFFGVKDLQKTIEKLQDDKNYYILIKMDKQLIFKRKT